MSKLFYRAKRLKNEKQNNTSPFYSALLSVVLCMVCLAGTTWAWFTANQQVDIDTITAAEWSLKNVEVYQIENAVQLTRTASDGDAEQIQIPVDVTETEDAIKFSADANTPYLVYITVTGNSNNGFLLIETCDGDYYSTESHINLEMLLSKSSTVTISASWGIYTGDAEEFFEDDCIGNGVVPECICDTLCTDGVVNEECKMCTVNHSVCAGEELKECICTNKCEDEENVDCPVCAENKELCTGEKVEPVDLVCSCEIKCTEVNESCEICKDSIENCNGREENTQETTPTAETDTEQEDTVPPPTSEPEVTESPTIEDSDSSEGQETSEVPEIVGDEETTESTDIITESTSESESEDTLDTEDIATDANADKAEIPEAVSDGDVETAEEHDAPEA